MFKDVEAKTPTTFDMLFHSRLPGPVPPDDDGYPTPSRTRTCLYGEPSLSDVLVKLLLPWNLCF